MLCRRSRCLGDRESHAVTPFHGGTTVMPNTTPSGFIGFVWVRQFDFIDLWYKMVVCLKDESHDLKSQPGDVIE